MSIDRSLCVKDKLKRQRNVMTRAERLERLLEEERWQEGDSVFGLPKVLVARARKKPKAEKKEEVAEEAVVETEGAESTGSEKAPEGQ